EQKQFSSCNADIKILPKNCIHPLEGPLGVFFHTELQQAVNKADTVPALVKQMALQIINEIPGVDIQIYTDGRRNEENQSGTGIYINICAKCGVASASPEHILSCLRLSRETFETDPLLALDFLRVSGLMDGV
ncbi:hypothetical protein AVEN_176930-1, partial [Araneus ventricosus]